MTHTCCPRCHLRFEAVAYGDDRCSTCQGELEVALPSQLIGYRLAGATPPTSLADAVAAALPDPSRRP